MKHIILTEEQAKAVLDTNEQVEVLDPQGRTVAHLRPFGPISHEEAPHAREDAATGMERWLPRPSICSTHSSRRSRSTPPAIPSVAPWC